MRSIQFWIVPLQSDLVGDVVKLLVADFFELLALGFQLLVDLDDFLGHPLVGFLRAADQREIRSGRDALLAVGIQPDADHHRFTSGLFIVHIRHGAKLGVQRG